MTGMLGVAESVGGKSMGGLFVFWVGDVFQNVSRLAVERLANGVEGGESHAAHLPGFDAGEVHVGHPHVLGQFVERHFAIGEHAI